MNASPMQESIEMDIDFSKLSSSAKDCFHYLISALSEEGKFIYELHSKRGTVSNSYNILRHAGSMFVLYQSLPLELYDKELAIPMLERGMEYLIKHIKALKELPDIFCLVEDNETKLGGTGLALLAMVERYNTRPENQDLLLMQKLGAFLIWMQEPSGKFKSKILYQENTLSPFESIYYPGEAILALIHLYSIDPNPKWLNAAELGADYLVQNPIRHNRRERGHNHWFAIALSELYFILPKKEYYNEITLIVDCTVISVDENLHAVTMPKSIVKPFSSAAMATRGEAVLAGALLELRLKNYLRTKELINSLKHILSYCMNLQITANKPAAHSYNTVGGIMKSRKNRKVRIDYVQHYMAIAIGLLMIYFPPRQLK
jgi:hypothetical protein